MEDADRADVESMAALAAGDMAALGELAQRHQEKVLALAYRILGRWDLAEDVAQDVFLQVHRAAKRYRPDAKFTTWLYRVAVNRCLDVQRRAARAPVALPEQADVLLGESAGDPVEAGERAVRVRRAVADLPPRQRVALVLHRFHEMSHEQVARVTGWSQSAVESLLVRAYARLREELAALAKG